MEPLKRLRPWALGLLLVLVAACGSAPTAAPSAASTPLPSVPAPSSPPLGSSPSPSVAPTPSVSLPPASATITFTGGATEVAKGAQISCQLPSLGGSIITIFGSTNRTGVATTISLSSGSIAVTLDSGSGATFAAREFTGAGVTNFDAARGAQIDSPLQEVTTGSAPGKVPAVRSIKGSVDCGNQTPGTSTLMLTGNAAELAVSGPIDPIRVDCNPNAKPATVHAVGILNVGSRPVVIVFQATATGFTTFLAPTVTTLQHFYTNTDPTSATISPTGAHVSGSATESGTANTLQVSGDLVCGVINP